MVEITIHPLLLYGSDDKDKICDEAGNAGIFSQDGGFL